MKEYREIIAEGFNNEKELNAFIETIADDEKISARAYENLRHEAIKRFYED